MVSCYETNDGRLFYASPTFIGSRRAYDLAHIVDKRERPVRSSKIKYRIIVRPK